MNWPEIHRIYFIGIGGIGMSALARYCKAQGKIVSGYDRAETILTKELEQEGISIHYTDDITLLDKEAQLVVYTPAIPQEHAELAYYRSNQYVVIKRSELLKQITAHSRTLAIAGTHGKTTTTTMIAHILRQSNNGCTAFLGGISGNYTTNFWSSEGDIVVVEADEYDRSFLNLHPYVSVITSCEPDHLDIYKTHEAMLHSFQQFAALTAKHGLLIKHFGIEANVENEWTYDIYNLQADIHTLHMQLSNGYYSFDVRCKDQLIKDIKLPIPGLHNVENALAAIGVSVFMGIPDQTIREALGTFKGVKRRFEILLDNNFLTYVDDYAHHPTEIKAAIQALRVFKPNKKLSIIFQPHLFSRTRDFAKGFAEALSLADEVILLPIYAARELPLQGINSEYLCSLIKNTPAKVVDKKDLMDELKKQKLEVLCTLGAGDIDQFAEPIKTYLLTL